MATITCASRAWFACGRSATPPYTVATRNSRGSASVSISCETWTASSRVGTSTSAAGRASSRGTRWTSGIANASVLPEPVGDFASRSVPARAGGMARVWIWNGLVMPLASSAAMDSALTPSAANVSCDM